VSKEELLTAMTWLTMPALLGPVCGPPLGGLLTDAVSWRAVFWINVPVGLLGFLLVWRFIPEVEQQDPGPLDAAGLILWGVAIALFMAGLETLGRDIAPAWFAPAALLVALGLAMAGIRHSRSVARPAVDLSLLRIPSFAMPTLAGNLFRAGAGAVPFLLPLSLQLAFGLSATNSGLVTFATALGAFAMKPLIKPLLRRFGFRTVLAANGVLAAIGVAACALFSPSWPLIAIFVVLAAGGLSRSLQFTSLNTLAFADVPQAKLAAASAMSGTLQQLSVALGVVVGSLALAGSQYLNGQAYPELGDFRMAFLVSALVVLGCVPFALRLPRHAGSNVSGHHASVR
jgi:MFS family permease